MVFLGCLFAVVVFLVLEKILHDRRLRRIPIRIHVNGTRGKSTVVRLLASALREAGIKTLAKTTGDAPILIYPDGVQKAIARRGRPRIQEQAAAVRLAAKLGAEAVVVECMALEPGLQHVCETGLLRSTIGVITNVRPDHQEVMGRSLGEVAEALSRTIPRAGRLVTADPAFAGYFARGAEARGSQFHFVQSAGPDQAAGRGQAPVLTINQALAAEVCSLLAVLAPAAAAESADPDRLIVEMGGRTVHFIDAFSVNDTVSAELIQREWLENSGCPRPVVALLNNRTDRPLRTRSFADFLARNDFYDRVLLMGGHRFLAQRLLARRGREVGVEMVRARRPEKVLAEIASKIPARELTLVGLGNHRGPGESLAHYLRKVAGR